MYFFPIGEAYPYVDNAKAYLLAGKDANIADFFIYMPHPNVPISVKWEKVNNADLYEIELFAKELETEPTLFLSSSDEEKLELFNLYKGADYTVRVTAFQGEKPIDSGSMDFKTTALGPRVMMIDSIYNVRDLGGYTTLSGKTTRQGFIYRGGSLTPTEVCESSILTESGKSTMKNIMKIKTEIELRHQDETGAMEASPIPGAEMIRIVLGSYADAFSDSESGKPAFRQFFSTIADKEKYPIYFHCTGGADRTGTVSFLLNALLGVPEETLIQDYEFTSFSIHHMRNSREGTYFGYYSDFRNTLNDYDGDTLQKKVHNYLLSIGVTEKEIESITDIMM